MRIGRLLTILSTVPLLACSEHAAMDLDALIARHAEARGGTAAIESIETLGIVLEITEPEFSVVGRYFATRDGHARVDIYADGERVFSEAISPEGGWQHAKGQSDPAPLSVDGRNALERGRIGNLYGLHELRGLGHELTLAGTIVSDGADFWAVDALAPDGASTRLLIDKETFLLVRERETSALHPDIDATKVTQETQYTDYRVEGDVLFAHRSEKRELESGELLQTIVITGIETNLAINRDIFLQPD